MIIADLLKKLNDTECKVPSITGLATTPAFNAVKAKIPDVSDLVKKKKQSMMQKYKTLRANISPHLITINFWVICLMQR